MGTYRELIYIEGGPQWHTYCSGRADIVLLQPVDSTVLYPNEKEGGQEYIRTTRTWVSPIYGTIHTIFQHQRPVT